MPEKIDNHFLLIIRKIVKKRREKLIILADYFSKPKISKNSLASVTNANVIKILQIEGQTSLFLQIADILLGALNYDKVKRKDKIKEELVKKILTIIKWQK